jgi:hypothetical protein
MEDRPGPHGSRPLPYGWSIRKAPIVQDLDADQYRLPLCLCLLRQFHFNGPQINPHAYQGPRLFFPAVSAQLFDDLQHFNYERIVTPSCNTQVQNVVCISLFQVTPPRLSNA